MLDFVYTPASWNLLSTCQVGISRVECRPSGRVGATGPQAAAVSQCRISHPAQFIPPLLKVDGYKVSDWCLTAHQEIYGAVCLI